MTIAEIKIQSLKLMFVNYNTDIAETDLGSLMRDESFGSYLVSMTGCLNRCFSVIEQKGVLPVKSHILLREEGTATGVFMRFDLAALIPEFDDVSRLIYATPDGDYNGDAEYHREGDTIVIEGFKDGCFTVLYTPKLKRITLDTPDSEELAIPDSIACHIPYFVKGELYRDDEPNEASEARNWFEAAMEELRLQKYGRQGHVESVYKMR